MTDLTDIFISDRQAYRKQILNNEIATQDINSNQPTLILLRNIKSTHQRRARILPIIGFGDAVAEAWSRICFTGGSMRPSVVHRLEVS